MEKMFSLLVANGSNKGSFLSQLTIYINIVLIPKVDHPRGMKDFRPISLYNVVYQILAKVLTNRLSKVIDKCVSKEQYAFVLGRSIVDNALVASKIMHNFRLVNKFA